GGGAPGRPGGEHRGGASRRGGWRLPAGEKGGGEGAAEARGGGRPNRRGRRRTARARRARCPPSWFVGSTWPAQPVFNVRRSSSAVVWSVTANVTSFTTKHDHL